MADLRWAISLGEDVSKALGKDAPQDVVFYIFINIQVVSACTQQDLRLFGIVFRGLGLRHRPFLGIDPNKFVRRFWFNLISHLTVLNGNKPKTAI